MQEVFDKIIEKIKTDPYTKLYGSRNSGNYMIPVDVAIKIVKQEAAEHNNDWIPCSERLPEESESIFAKYKGTEKWKDNMFEKMSDEVNVAIEKEDGKWLTMHAHTVDGK